MTIKQFHYFTLAFLFTITLGYSQSKINAYLLDSNGVKKQIFLPSQKVILDKENVIQYYDNSESKSLIVATSMDIKEIGYSDGSLVIVSEKIKEIHPDQNIFLRKLSVGFIEILQYSDEAQSYYIVKRDGSVEDVLRIASTEKSNEKSFKEVLFVKYNPNNTDKKSYQKLSFDEEGITEYFLNNYTEEPIEILSQEKKVKSWNYSGFAGYSIGSAEFNSGESGGSKTPLNGFHFNARAEKNLDRITNLVTAFGGMKYYSLSGDNEFTLNQQSSVNRTETNAEVEMKYLSFELGVKYNIHINYNFTISPLLSFEKSIGNSNNDIVFFDLENGERITSASNFPKDLDNIHIGVEVAVKRNFLLRVSYSLFISQEKVVNFINSGSTLENTSKLSFSKLDLSFGYRF